jgi:uncharacterized membrane protein
MVYYCYIWRICITKESFLSYNDFEELTSVLITSIYFTIVAALSSPIESSCLVTEEDGSSLIAIHKETFHKLVTALRTAVASEYKLDKEQTSYNDILDAFRLSLQFYKRSKLNFFTK